MYYYYITSQLGGLYSLSLIYILWLKMFCMDISHIHIAVFVSGLSRLN